MIRTITFNVVCAAVHELEEIREGIEHPVMGRRRELSIEEDDGNKRQQMPRVSVMIKLILTMVWRNLLRNPNAWASVFGLVWSLIFFRYFSYLFITINGKYTQKLEKKNCWIFYILPYSSIFVAGEQVEHCNAKNCKKMH